MNELKLQVGKSYRVANPDGRNPAVVKIVTHDKTDNVYPFEGDDGCWYRANGVFSGTDDIPGVNPYDLVEEL